jgi:hypothetical protein
VARSLRANSAVLCVHDQALEGAARLVQETLNEDDIVAVGRSKSSRKRRDGLIALVSDTASSWTLTDAVTHLDLSNMPKDIDAEPLLGAVRGCVDEGSRAADAASAANRLADSTRELTARFQSAQVQFAELQSLMTSLYLDTEGSQFSGTGDYEREEDRFRELLTDMDARFTAVIETTVVETRRSFLTTVPMPPFSAHSYGDALGKVAEDLAGANETFLASLSRLDERLTKRQGPSGSREHQASPAQLVRSDLEAHLSSARAYRERGQNLDAVLELTDVPLAAIPQWRPSRRYLATLKALSDELQKVVDAHGDDVATWASDVAHRWSDALEASSHSLAAEGDVLRQALQAAWVSLTSSAGALRTEARELLFAAPLSGSANQVRLAASAGCALTIAGPCRTAWQERIAGTRVGPFELDPSNVFLGLRTTLGADADSVANLMGSAHVLEAARDAEGGSVIEAVLTASALPEEVQSWALSSFGAMHGSDQSPATRDAASALGSWSIERVAARRDTTEAKPLPSTPEAPASSIAVHDAWRPLLAALEALVARPDPHKGEVDELKKLMSRVGLADRQTAVAGSESYQHLLAGHARGNTLCIEAFGQAVHDRWAELRSRVDPPHAISADPGATEARELAAAVEHFHLESSRYLQLCRQLLAPWDAQLSKELAAGDASSIDRNGSIVATAASVIEASELEPQRVSEFWAGVAHLCGATLPVASGWEPAERFESAAAELADALLESAARLTDDLASEVKTAAGDVANEDAQLRLLVEEHLHALSASQLQAWNDLDEAAHAVRCEVLRRLLSAPDVKDGALPVKAAVSVYALDTVAAQNLGLAVNELIPDGNAPTAAQSVDDRLKLAEQRATTYRANSTVLAGADGVLLGVMASEGWATFSPSALGLGAMSGDLHAASSELITALHNPEFLHELSSNATGVVGYVTSSVMPGAHHGLSLEHLVTSLAHNWISPLDMLKSFDQPELLGRYVLEHELLSPSAVILKDVLHTPSGHEAFVHLDHAGTLAGLDVLHGLVAHLPIITAVVATAREMRIQREYELSVQSSITNAAVDVAAVGGGAAAAIAATAPIHVGPHALVTIPAAAIGGIVGKFGVRYFRVKKLNRLQEQFSATYDRFTIQRDEMVGNFANTVNVDIDKARGKFLAAIGKQPSLDPLPGRQAKELVQGLRQATVRYAECLGELAESVPKRELTKLSGKGSPTQIRSVVKRVDDAGRACEEFLESNDWVGGTLAITAPELPVCEGWVPSATFARASADAARALTDGGDAGRRKLRQWLNSTLDTFNQTKAGLDRQLQSSDAALKQAWTSAWDPVHAAYKVIQPEVARLGGHS